MIVNRTGLLRAAPIKDMLSEKVQGDLTSYGLTECGYDIRIAEDVYFTGKHNKELHPMVQITLPDGNVKHENGILALGSSMEEFNMPAFLMGRVLNKSTWARQGLDASMTTNIEPGWRGFLTIELLYHGMDNLFIPAGSGICQVIFETIQENAFYVGKYQDQESGPQKARTKEEGPVSIISANGVHSSNLDRAAKEERTYYQKSYGPFCRNQN